jgi:hypothetical protein
MVHGHRASDRCAHRFHPMWSRSGKTLEIYVVLFCLRYNSFHGSLASRRFRKRFHYIEQQFEHHRTRTFQEEYLAFLKETRRTFRRKIPLELGAPDHTVPYGTVPFQSTHSQALRARPPSQTSARPTAKSFRNHLLRSRRRLCGVGLRSVCPYGTRLQPFRNRLSAAMSSPKFSQYQLAYSPVGSQQAWPHASASGSIASQRNWSSTSNSILKTARSSSVTPLVLEVSTISVTRMGSQSG